MKDKGSVVDVQVEKIYRESKYLSGHSPLWEADSFNAKFF
jgi:hypothetical protein